MELRQLEYSVAVAEERNFTRAAERVHISQSGVSAQIRQLERDLGTELFGRSARGVTLTAAGEAALTHARAALAAAEAIGQAVGEVAEVLRGRLTVGMVTGCTLTPLFDALAAFHRTHPGVELSLVEGHSLQLLDAVRSGTVDVALVGTATASPEGLEALPVVAERLVVAVPPSHPLARRKRVTLRDVCEHPLVCMPPGTGLRAVFDRACAARNLRPSVTLQASAPEAVADLAARGLAVAVLSASTVGTDGERLVARTIDDAEDLAYLTLAWRPSPSPATRTLLHHARPAFA
ncbi:LysR family transcriptional regulator [Streptomyces sp. WMMC897]|uniref:LysR family transcriptional regulator n=1 Tax=Streptomyces sp. WMMC897 TaxID=3014782 RepID=UPI0022B6762B|nr:LysR family transcriptional regulator [Streptomyces sp. WMMC897]MCZ7417230.1 LysR family transcriptional regulator [Streptomyces sp. WMMC897]